MLKLVFDRKWSPGPQMDALHPKPQQSPPLIDNTVYLLRLPKIVPVRPVLAAENGPGRQNMDGTNFS